MTKINKTKTFEVDCTDKKTRHFYVPTPNFDYKILEMLSQETTKKEGREMTPQRLAYNFILLGIDAYLKLYNITLVDPNVERLAEQVKEELGIEELPNA